MPGATGPADTITIRSLKRVSDIPAARWDRCAGTENPFLAHAFLDALEQSGCVTPRTGWQPIHLVAETPDGEIAGILPLYVKGHSQGEYIFDHAWADAYARAGGSYYPKLLSAVPFTPVTGPRFLVAPGQDFAAIAGALLQGAKEIAREHGLSSLHVNFLPKAQSDWAQSAGMLLRLGEQFHWTNDGYRDFDDFLEQLASRKRKTIRKERREAVAAGIDIVTLSGGDLTDEHWDAFFGFYMDTGSRKWGRPYLNREFFRRLHASMADRVVLVMARREGRWIAGAWNMLGSDTLYGRNWGCIEYHPCLHFECCYYQAIDYAIRHGLKRVEAGAQGEHKLARGYLPVPIYSVHWLTDPGFQAAVARYLEEERAYMEGVIEALDQHSPFRQAGPPPDSD
ncbi:GNAT family N-acetyltransferase [uncultured Ferrovibrio sp.]|jgi:predicted N-acyltransferase|uniref:GNAT family N-acetyltransferase n=1 Tax=uncultured Ferrovibrio sp. TaxID=1576913 RepID=UPI00261176C1|nr:GNAT family N-acetyltransferase [uncultured Ferrovibrio sp.]